MGKVKIGHYCSITADILSRVLQKCSLSSPLPNILFLSKPLNMIGCKGNRTVIQKKKKKKKSSPQKPKGNKAEVLQKCLLDWCVCMCVCFFFFFFFFLLLAECFHCYTTSKNFQIGL